MMNWSEIGKSSLRAAKRTIEDEPRSAASRSYYAAHVVLAAALVEAGCPLSAGRQTPSHHAQAKLIGEYLSGKGAAFVRELRAEVRRLYARRIDADYKRTVTIDRLIARESLRDASTVFELLEVR